MFGALSAGAPARAQAKAASCPGNPNAIGTSRVIAIKYGEYTKLGRLQYPQTLPLADHEVVLTFDDGPMRLLSERALDILNSQCVKVTYFVIGQMAHYFPDIVRREYASGDAIGTHSEHHPLPFNRLSDQRVQQEIDEGIASVGAALGDPKKVAPFFRIPGFGRSKTVEDELAKRKLIVFSTDVVADDWFRHITPAQIVQRAMSRLEKRGRGILLLHDIHPATVLALPTLLQQLKAHGFRIVQVVPAGPGMPVTPPVMPAPVVAAVPAEPSLAAAMPGAPGLDDASPAPAWPQPDATVTAEQTMLPAPAAVDFSVKDSLASDGNPAANGGIPWPAVLSVALPASDVQLPAPGLRDIGVSVRGQKLVGVRPRSRASAGIRAIRANRHAHPIRLHARRTERPRERATGQHAGLISRILRLAFLPTPTATR